MRLVMWYWGYVVVGISTYIPGQTDGILVVNHIRSLSTMESRTNGVESLERNLLLSLPVDNHGNEVNHGLHMNSIG